VKPMPLPREETRAQKIARLKKQVQDGTYKVDADKVAEAILHQAGQITEGGNRSQGKLSNLAQYAVFRTPDRSHIVIELETGRLLGIHAQPGRNRQYVEDSLTGIGYHYHPLTESQRKRFSKIVQEARQND